MQVVCVCWRGVLLCQ